MTSKKLRFEIFKRDEFTCQYCGRRPPEVVLELDHIEPRAAGGTNDEINLVTSCFDCNRGKSDKRLGDVHPRPDADLKFLEFQQEIVEADRYLRASVELETRRERLVDHLYSIWNEVVSDEYAPTDKQFKTWLLQFSPDEIEYAIRQTGPKFERKQFGWPSEYAVNQAIRYASGIMNAVRRERAEGGIQ